MSSRSTRQKALDAQMLAQAEQLFDDYEQLPILTVLQALNAARRELRQSSNEPPRPAVIAALARERLDARVSP